MSHLTSSHQICQSDHFAKDIAKCRFSTPHPFFMKRGWRWQYAQIHSTQVHHADIWVAWCKLAQLLIWSWFINIIIILLLLRRVFKWNAIFHWFSQFNNCLQSIQVFLTQTPLFLAVTWLLIYNLDAIFERWLRYKFFRVTTIAREYTFPHCRSRTSSFSGIDSLIFIHFGALYSVHRFVGWQNFLRLWQVSFSKLHLTA